MNLRTRLILAVCAMALVTFGAAMVAVLLEFERSELHQLDDAIRTAAREDAREASKLGDEAIAESAEPDPDQFAKQLPKFGVLYTPEGKVVASTPFAACPVPEFATIAHPTAVPFDVPCAGDLLRGVLVHVHGRPDRLYFFAVSRRDLDHDVAFLKRTMVLAMVAALLASAIISVWIVRSLTRDLDAITLVARAVAAGNLSARVRSASSNKELRQLANDVDEMIQRLEVLVGSQQRFIAHAAHELRSPLTTLYGELSLALRRSRDADAYKKSIEEALSSTRELKQLAEDLLTLARTDATADGVEAASLRTVVNDAIALVQSSADERGVAVVVVGNDVSVRGRPRDLRRMVRNLVENAVSHSERGMTVSVQMEEGKSGDVRIVVEDEGPGVPLEDRERIFEPFFRVARDRGSDRKGEGAGLGLLIAREIARAHGGEVIATDRPSHQKGACFVASIHVH